MTPATVLLVDDDTWMRRLVSSVLEPHGIEVVAAADAEEAFAQVARVDCAVLIVEVRMKGAQDGFALVEKLRERSPACARAPVLFLGSPVPGKGVVRAGVDEFLPKPIHLDTLLERVEIAVRRRGEQAAPSPQPLPEPPAKSTRTTGLQFAQAPPQTPSPPSSASSSSQSVAVTPVVLVGAGPPTRAATQGPAKAIVGTLDKVALSSLLVLLEMERASGVLVMLREGRVGRVFARAGRVIAAFVDGESLAGKEAVYHLLTWNAGRFEFSTASVDMKDEIDASTEELLLEGARRIDEAKPVGGA